jgi:hypothetical protein
MTQVSGANNFVPFDVDAGNPGVVTISGSTLATSAVAEVAVAADKLSASVTGGATVTFTVPTKTPGTITVNFYATTNGATSTTITDQLVITVIDSAQLLPSVANSTSILSDDGTPTTPGKDDTIAAVGLGASTQVAEIDVVINDGTASGGQPIDAVVLSAVVSGSGLIEDNATPGTARVAVATTAGGGLAKFNVYSDGTAGTGTITISAGTTVIATEKVTFSGAPTKVVATQGIKVTDGTTAAGAFTYTVPGVGDGAVTLLVTDANGNPVPNVDGVTYAIVAKSSDKTIMTETTGFATAGSADGNGNYTLQATAATTTAGKSASITYVVVDVTTEAVLATSAPITYAVGSTTIATLALSFDKATYAPGEKATLTLTAKDAGGFAVADGGYDVFAGNGVAYAGMTASASLTTSPFSYAAASQTTFSGGVATATAFMPLTSGPMTVTGKSVAGVAGVAGSTITATATVGTNADISAITTLINSLIAKINALNKLVVKIQKKVNQR